SRGRRVRGQLGRRPDGARLEVPSAVRADAVQDLVDAARAERALEGADAGVETARRQVRVTALAVGTELEHDRSLRRSAGTAPEPAAPTGGRMWDGRRSCGPARRRPTAGEPALAPGVHLRPDVPGHR